jgi:hypothetical protein
MTEKSFNEIIEKLNIMITESRNHHEILLYNLEDKIKLLAEGQAMTNENLERFKEYVEGRFNELNANINMLIMRDSPSRPEFQIAKKQVRKLNEKVFG